MLRAKLEEATRQVEQSNAVKANMQDNLKKAFMRGVCALNYEAMNILDSGDGSNPMGQIEKEMAKQIDQAFMNNSSISNQNDPTPRT